MTPYEIDQALRYMVSTTDFAQDHMHKTLANDGGTESKGWATQTEQEISQLKSEVSALRLRLDMVNQTLGHLMGLIKKHHTESQYVSGEVINHIDRIYSMNPNIIRHQY